jgi:cell division protein FtsN
VNQRQRISARDYKHGGGRRGGFDLQQYRQFGYGLAAGLAVAIGVFVFDHRGGQGEAAAAREQPAKKKAAAASAEPEQPVEQYDYYSVLPKYEVVLPEERNVRRDKPAEPITQPGNYMIQAGSFANEKEALRRQQNLAKLGIQAAVQRVAVDADVNHRVRIGPVGDLGRLNEIRNVLRTADIDLLIIRMPD